MSSHQTVGVDLLGFDSLLRCDLLDVFLSLLQPVERKKKTHKGLIFAETLRAKYATFYTSIYPKIKYARCVTQNCKNSNHYAHF